MPLKQFKIISKIGQGSYSTVYKVRKIQDNTLYALKKVKLHNLSEKEKQDALNQILRLVPIQHQNILGYEQVFIQNNTLCIIMQIAHDENLLQRIVEYKNNNKKFQENKIWDILIQISRGLKVLHQLNIFHRDLKSVNIFLSRDGVIKIGDINQQIIKKCRLIDSCNQQICYYSSPQIWKEKPYDSKSDMWSLGCIIYQMVTLNTPFRAKYIEELYLKIIKGKYSDISNIISQQLSNIIKKLLQVNPRKRPSSQQILNCIQVKTKIQQLKFPKLAYSNNQEDESYNKKKNKINNMNSNSQLESNYKYVHKARNIKNSFKQLRQNAEKINKQSHIYQRLKINQLMNIKKNEKLPSLIFTKINI